MTTVTATVVKEERSSKLGIAFERLNEATALKIKLIREDGLFKGSDLVPGLVVLSAAGEDMVGRTPKDAADALRSAPGGEDVTVVCRGAKSTIHKEKVKRFKKAPKLGISFKSSTAEPGKVYVSNINDDSKFATTDLKVGHRVLAINGRVCPPKVADAVELLKDPESDTVTIISIDPEDEVVAAAAALEASSSRAAEAAAMEDPPAGERSSTDVVEEKKSDFPEEADEQTDGEHTEEDTSPEANKPLLDTVFGACMC